MKAKLYSNFVKSGTLTGGKMEETEEGDSGFVEDKVKAQKMQFVLGMALFVMGPWG